MLKANFTRASIAYLKDGTQVASGVPRFEWGRFGTPSFVGEHNNKVIMVEEGTTNLLTSPSNFGAAAWTTTGTITRVDNGEGTWTLTDSATTDSTVKQLVTVANDSVSRTFWVDFVKDSDETRFVELALVYSGGTTSSYGVHLNTKTGAAAVRLANASGSYSVEDRGTAWRFAITLLNNNTGNTSLLGLIRPAAGTVLGVHSDAATGSCKVMRAQLEAKPYATSFIDGTRVIEKLSVPTAGVVSPTEGTFEGWYYVNDVMKHAVIGTSVRLFHVSRDVGINNNGFLIYHNGTNFWAQVYDGTTITTSAGKSSVSMSGWHHFAITWSASAFRFYVDGVQIGTDLVPALPSGLYTYAYIGCHDYSNTANINSLVDSVRLSNIARTDAEILASYQSSRAREL